MRERIQRWREVARAKGRDYFQALLFITLIVLFLVVFLAPRIFVVIGPGEVGVKYDLAYGTQVDRVYPEGLNIIAPWNRMYIYNTRVQETKRTLYVLTADGLMVQLDLSIRYRPEVEMIGVLHQEVGPDYENKIVVPEVESVIRTSVGRLTAEQLYTATPNKRVLRAEEVAEGVAAQSPTEAAQAGATPTPPPTPPTTPTPATTPAAAASPGAPPAQQPTATPAGAAAAPAAQPAATAGASPQTGTGEVVQPAVGTTANRQAPVATYTDYSDDGDELSSLTDIIKRAVREVSKRYVLVDDVIITRSIIPEYVQKAIQQKLEQKELAKAQEYRLMQVTTEREIKRIEADINTILNGTLTTNLLTMKGIEATRELATSPNSKVIVIGSGDGGLPVILNPDR